jgi:hypothetical protein
MHAQGAVEDEDDDYLGFSCSSDADIPADTPTYRVDITRADFIAFQLSDPILLLDSCSTLNRMVDETLLHDIHKVNKTTRQCT